MSLAYSLLRRKPDRLMPQPEGYTPRNTNGRKKKNADSTPVLPLWAYDIDKWLADGMTYVEIAERVGVTDCDVRLKHAQYKKHGFPPVVVRV